MKSNTGKRTGGKQGPARFIYRLSSLLKWTGIVHNVHTRIIHHLGLIRNEYVTYRMRNGLNLKVRTGGFDSYVIRDMYIEKPYYDPEPSGEVYTVIDCGAHVGVWTTRAANADRGKIRVFAYEPFPDNFRLLADNVESNGLENVEIFQLAVGGSAGKRKFYLSDRADDSHSLLVGEGDSIEVGVTTLADIIEDNSIGRVDLLKLDVEGSEYEILLNLDRKYFDIIERVTLEYHEHPDFGEDDLAGLFKGRGFIVERPANPLHRNVFRATRASAKTVENPPGNKV